MQDAVTDDVIAEIRRLLDDASLRAQWAETNRAVGRSHFSLDEARRRLAAVIAELGGG
jgi:hypothetical protein